MKRLVNFLTASAVALAISGAAQAQSTFGCQDLDGFHSLPSLEGAEGYFFRVEPELRNFFPMSDETVDDMARLSQELAQSGTTLVYLPIPPKALVMTGHLPPRAYDYGFDPQLAATVYDDMIKRLTEAGVIVADPRRALVAGALGGEAPYFKADFRLNALGARLAAQSVAQALQGGGTGAGQGGFAQPFLRQTASLTSQGMIEIDSHMRQVLQRHCLIELPKVTTEAFDAATAQAVSASGGRMGPNVALVGSDYSATPGINFAGFLGQALGLPVNQVSVPGGGAYAGFSAYVTSDAFQQARPSVLVWEVPAYANLARYGDQPMREIIAASSGNACRTPLLVQALPDGTGARADLSGLDPSRSYTLAVDTGGTQAGMAQFTFNARNGFQLTKTITREAPETRTGRFFVPMSGLWAEGAQFVDITLDAEFGAAPRVTACTY